MPFRTFPQLHLLFPSGNSKLKQPGVLIHFSVVSGHPTMFAKHLETWGWLGLCICADQISSKGICSPINTPMSSEMYPGDPEAHHWCGKRGVSCISLQGSPEKRDYFGCGIRRATVLAKPLPKLSSRTAPASREYCSCASKSRVPEALLPDAVFSAASLKSKRDFCYFHVTLYADTWFI